MRALAPVPALLAAVLALVACRDEPRAQVAPDRLVGTWEAELRPLFESYYAGAGEEAAVEDALSRCYWRWYVQRGGRIVARQQLLADEEVSRGTWDVLSREGDRCQVRLVFDGGGVAFAEGALEFDGDDRFTIRISDQATGAEQSFEFRRRR